MKFAAKNHRFGEKTAAFAKKMATFLKNAKFDENFEIRERCKGVHCVDLGESFPTSIFLQNLVSIQLKTSPETSNFYFTITQHPDEVFDAPLEPGGTVLRRQLSDEMGAGLGFGRDQPGAGLGFGRDDLS